MAKSKRDNIILECATCGEQNYITTRNKHSHPNKMEIKKYCNRCKKVTVHKEAK
jgi:large subunit ribosomal protein L33